MAIKIIKNTMVEPIEMQCKNCESVFSFNYSDIEAFDRKSLWGTIFHERFVTCPVCKIRCYLETVQHHEGNEASQSFVDEGEVNESK